MDEAVLIPSVNTAAAEVGAITDEAHRWLVPQDRWAEFVDNLRRELGAEWTVEPNVSPHTDRLILSTSGRSHNLQVESFEREHGVHVVRLDTEGGIHV
ncbi:MAG: hypothetical protein JWO59_73 [Chloroflexi bacterium]|nr:hypothetical protein [Chloroflexota bacterium]